MKTRRIIGMLFLIPLLVAAAACSTGGETTPPPPPESASVNNNVTVTGDGNIEASSHSRLTFGSGGKIARIYVKEGDRVSRGDVLARLDTGALELAETRAQVALTQAQAALTGAELVRQTAEHNLQNTGDNKVSLELAISNAQVNVRTAKYNLEQTIDLYTWSDIKTAKADVDEARRYLEDSLAKAGLFLPKDELGQYPSIEEYIFSDDFPKPPGYELWQEQLVHAQSRLNTAQDRLDAMLSGSDPEEVAIKRLQLETAEKAEAQAQQNLEKLTATLAIRAFEVESAKEAEEAARQNVTLARQALEKARQDLDEATVIAPFEGTVAAVGMKEGEFLSPATFTGMTVVEVIDLRHMELKARVDELDVAMVKAGQKVMISVDAVPELKLEGSVTFISPVASERAGVVMYEVKIDFDNPDNSPIRDGMSATAEIIIG